MKRILFLVFVVFLYSCENDINNNIPPLKSGLMPNLIILSNTYNFDIYGRFGTDTNYILLNPESDKIIISIKDSTVGELNYIIFPDAKDSLVSLKLVNKDSGSPDPQFGEPAGVELYKDENIFFRHWYLLHDSTKTIKDVQKPNDIKFQAVEMSDNSIFIEHN